MVVVVNGQTVPVRVYGLTVAAALAQAGLTLQPEDAVDPPPETRLTAGQTITVTLARPVIIQADGHTRRLFTRQTRLADILAEAGLPPGPRDGILLNGTPAHPDDPLPVAGGLAPPAPLSAGVGSSSGRMNLFRGQPVWLTLRRASAITLIDDGVRADLVTTRPTVGEALAAAGVVIYQADRLLPPPETPVSPGMTVVLERSIPATINADGRAIKTRTRAATVAELLAQEGILLMGQDYTRPALSRRLSPGEVVSVVRVREVIDVQQEFIPFETRWLPDQNMELDHQELRQQGENGVIKTRFRIRYENGRETARVQEDRWVDREPQHREIVYGTKIVVRTVETEAGPLEYWRKIPMLTTAYSAATSGKDLDHPRYGITRSGLPAGYGKVAVDPKVIPLMTELYIPGYGKALAADTGGLIRGKHIDLGFDEDQPLPSLYEWRDVYVLTPVPPPDQIRYVLPNWPQR